MNILLIFTFFIISGGVRCFDVIGYSGGSVLVSSWIPWCENCSKYMTKLYPQTNIINYKKHKQWINEGRFTLFSNEYGKLMIFIRDVNTHDSGTYWIDVVGQWSIDMILKVKEDSCCGASQRVMVNTGQTANFTCQYSQDYKTDDKIIYRERKDSIERIHSTWQKYERFSISDDEYNNLFSLRITDVRSEDAGVYLCGVWLHSYSYSYSYSYFILTAVHLHIMSKVGVVTASGYSAGGIIFKCHHHQYKSNTKYVSKESDGCCERKYPSVQDQWTNSGDVCLYDDTSAGVLMVYFKELNAGHAGTYRCGVNTSQYTDTYTQVKLDVKDDSVLSLYWANKSVSVGDEVNITCRIPEEHKSSPKFFYKEDENHIFQTVSRSKVKLNDFSDKSVFTVIISDVTVRDAGVYWCGAETSNTDFTFISLTTKVQLKLNMPPVFGDEGGSARIICPYDPVYKPKTIKLLKSCTEENTLMEMNRWSVNDDTTASVFSVNITGLTAEDAGKYCCAVTLETDVIYLYTHLIIIIKQELLLNKSEGDNMSMECKHHADYQKVFCKAHEVSMCVNDGVSLQSIRDDGFSLSDETSTGVFTVNISHLREEHSGIYWCGSHIITKVHLEVKTSVFEKIIAGICVTPLLIGALILILYKFRYLKTRGTNGETERKQRTSGEVSNAASDYENVQDLRPERSASHYTEAVIYSTVGIPANTRHPHTLYSTVQSPTIPSDDVLYTAVSFHKHEDSLSDATVTFSKDEILTEYAAVNRNTRLN